MRAFPVPDLKRASQPPLRPSWFARELNDVLHYTEYVTALKQCYPRAYRKLKRRTPRACFVELFDQTAALFPINKFLRDEAEAGEELEMYGIPFEVFGIDPYDDNVDSPAIALTFLYSARATAKSSGFHHDEPSFDVLPVARANALLPDTPAHLIGTYKLAGKRRQFRHPWQHLHTFIARVLGVTENAFIDITYTMQAEAEMYPQWNRDEINALAAEWKRAKTILDAANEFQEYIDGKPAERLPLLAGALRRDPAVWNQITIGAPNSRKPESRGTLSRIFTEN